MRIITTASGIQEVHTSVTVRLDLYEKAKEMKISLRTVLEKALIDEITRKQA
nr:type II toxin-antitoxin system CcdA family antitoxin [uncultured Methanospirillum sp.]